MTKSLKRYSKIDGKRDRVKEELEYISLNISKMIKDKL